MTSRSSRALIAKQTVEFLQAGAYVQESIQSVSIADDLSRAISGTIVYSPEDFPAAFAGAPTHESKSTEIVVQNCTTLAAARALLAKEPTCNPLCLNFASAKNPGGGFLNGSQAQEESLARASGLSACLDQAREYYAANRSCGTCLYTHYLIYSPGVPVFRDDSDRLLPAPYLASMITAPAVNAGALRRNEPGKANKVEATMLERIDRVLTIAQLQGHDTLVLGAWGCGVFKNDPAEVAQWFAEQLASDRHQGAFRKIVFAVLDREPCDTLRAFERQFAA